ncbi:response regulator [Oleiharenicola lentus]|jgi:PAS domain S-box-containing protein|uniref:histidine kinase n=1 Tax=Oleiharenicola lentus TaxID=2508720 RepID=A0A4Q1C4D0_9BACT|nr:CHASE domain-containing protein [Oleiharenicola lentus]RXK53242.1 response regulator [Oleiharenicola lentus]
MAPSSFLTKYRRGTVALVLLLGASLSVLMWDLATRQESERLRTAFLSRAQTQAAVAQQRLSAYQEMVYNLRDAFIGQSTVSREEFGRVSRSLFERHAGVQALQWVQIVPHEQRTAFEQQVAGELNRPFLIRQRQADGSLLPAAVGAEYFVINYLEPLAGNEAVLGYDVLTAPTAPILQAARTDRQFKVTPVLRLAQSTPGQSEPGVIFILPYWRTNGSDRGVEGFLQGVFLVQTMLSQSHQLTTNEALDTYYFDVSDGTNPQVLYANFGGAEPLRDNPRLSLSLPADDPADLQTTFIMGGRTWKMVIRQNAEWARLSRSNQPRIILGAGLIITALLALFVNSLLQRTAQIERVVHERTRQLRASEARLQDILDHSPALIFLKDLEGRFLLCNEAFCRYSRCPREKIIGRLDGDFVPGEDARRFREMDAQVLAAGKPIEFEIRSTDPADKTLYLTHKFPLLDERGRPYALCGIATDITDRQAAEEHKRLLERKLLEAQKLESLGVLAGGVAHDFNNILTSILGNASLAALDLPENHRVRRQLAQIERAAQRAADLCSQMLAYAGRATVLTAPVNLSELIRDTAALLEISVGKRVRLDLQLDDQAPAVLGDATQLRQIVMNLVINAADAMDQRADGVVIVRTATHDLAAAFFEEAIHSPKRPAGRYVGLEVSDNGSGMPPEVLARIFEPFFTTKFSGRGLGLAAVLGIVQSHGGALFVESTPGKGTTFRLFLPATQVQAAGTRAPFAPIPGSLRGTVLVVDDEESVRLVGMQTLTVLGVTALGAADGEAAIELLRTHAGPIDLVLLDLTMPGLSGDETLRRLREIRPDLRAIIMSGFSEGEIMQRCADLGIAGYLPKPFDVATLTAKVQPLLG